VRFVAPRLMSDVAMVGSIFGMVGAMLSSLRIIIEANCMGAFQPMNQGRPVVMAKATEQPGQATSSPDRGFCPPGRFMSRSNASQSARPRRSAK
jgi:hypothetical protein